MSTLWSSRRRTRTRPAAVVRESAGGPAPLVTTAAACRRQQIRHIEVDRDWRRCGSADGGCGVLLPLGQTVCPRCGQTNREDLLPLNIRRLLPTHDAYEHAVAVLRGTLAEPAGPVDPAGLAGPAGLMGPPEQVTPGAREVLAIGPRPTLTFGEIAETIPDH
ncbi:hypothetical protein [Frankia sp. AgKG'84/4]|uniref:hypothetical protein n=1 Tax=Frankia sp. AgKG'84/4 TaxID=573490 RepID=UPI002029E000|nr:hypothetical protein [Frankia sp. AgKG'84/4]MCL9795604.1 hypothetical protein [Frankia sp. AgKG'84/4]